MRTLISLTVGLVLFLAGMASADMILAVDFQLTGSPVEAGFSAFEVGSSAVSNLSQVFGDLTVTVHGTVKGRDRNRMADGGEYTFADLHDDLVTGFGSTQKTNEATLLSIANLAPNTQYQVQLWSFDSSYNDGAVYSWYDRTGGASNLMGTITNDVGTSPYVLAGNDAFSVVATVTSDANGLLEFGFTDSSSPGGEGSLNGLTLSTIPEPATMSLLLLGGVAALIRRR